MTSLSTDPVKEAREKVDLKVLREGFLESTKNLPEDRRILHETFPLLHLLEDEKKKECKCIEELTPFLNMKFPDDGAPPKTEDRPAHAALVRYKHCAWKNKHARSKEMRALVVRYTEWLRKFHSVKRTAECDA